MCTLALALVDSAWKTSFVSFLYKTIQFYHPNFSQLYNLFLSGDNYINASSQLLRYVVRWFVPPITSSDCHCVNISNVMNFQRSSNFTNISDSGSRYQFISLILRPILYFWYLIIQVLKAEDRVFIIILYYMRQKWRIFLWFLN